jgi:dethiobiotin synthetase
VIEPARRPGAAVLPGRTGWFVTGTGRGVGKTVVAAALCRLRSDLGREVVYVKPVQPGGADGEDDAADVAALTGVTTVTGPVVGPSLPPGIAARIGRAELPGAELVAVVTEVAAAHPDAELVIEGVGGLLDELGSDGTTAADLAAALGLPLVVVAGSGWDSLNPTALTLEAAAARGLDIAGVVVSASTHADPHHLAELARVAGGLAGVLPVLSLGAGGAALDDVAERLGPVLGGRWA